MVKQPLCFGCANGVARVMLDTCAEPGHVKSSNLPYSQLQEWFWALSTHPSFEWRDPGQ